MFKFSFSEKANELFEKEYDYYRKKIFFWISLSSSIVVLLLSLNHFYHDRFYLGLFTFILSNLLLFNSIIFYKKKNIVYASIPTFLFGIFTIGFSIKEQGILGLFWVYPSILVVHFILPWQISIPLNISLITVVGFVASEHLSNFALFRVLATLIFTFLLSNLFSALIFRIHNKIKDLVIRDPLTGVFNRRQLDIMLSQAQERFKRYATLSCILAIDVDHFKSINDTYGHGIGDEVLIQVVRVIQSKIRKLDSLFRIGGEEFIVLLPDTNLEGALVVAEKIRTEIEKAPILEDRTVTVSIGVAEILKQETIYQWINRCDKLLYKAKEEGRNKICF